MNKSNTVWLSVQFLLKSVDHCNTDGRPILYRYRHGTGISLARYRFGTAGTRKSTGAGAPVPNVEPLVTSR